MVLLTGQAECSIDAKQRLAIPAKFRQRLESAGQGPGWYAVPWPDGSILRLYPEAVFEAQAAARDDTLTPAADDAKIETALFGFAERLELDGNGRVRLPKWHLDLLGLPSEVTVVGVRNRLELHDRAAWTGGQQDRFRELQALVERAAARKRE